MKFRVVEDFELYESSSGQTKKKQRIYKSMSKNNRDEIGASLSTPPPTDNFPSDVVIHHLNGNHNWSGPEDTELNIVLMNANDHNKLSRLKINRSTIQLIAQKYASITMYGKGGGPSTEYFMYPKGDVNFYIDLLTELFNADPKFN